ncbi:MAG: zinc carboxypeptidase [Flavobacteriaceae bacterium]|nr:zinc carboxypeptidase [Flavobacteriaceae bacterium]
MRPIYNYIILFLFINTQVFSQNIQSPSEYLGYEIGTQFSRHSQVIDYFDYVSSELPGNVKMEKYGETYERRPLYLAYISSKENIKNIDLIRKNNLSNAGVIKKEMNSSINKDIAIVWLSYNVHGNESSSTEASMKTLYLLLTKNSNLLDNTIVIIDPCINPDGRDRYANWYNQAVTIPYNINSKSREHDEPWPGGRANHYLYDLNRDWAWITQTESKSRLKMYNKWLPHVHVDYHEQGIDNPYYFAPAVEPYHEIISKWQRDFQKEIGKNNAKYFDQNGWLYFTKETFDLLYPSYGDTYPTYLGAIGMTYEKAGGGVAGLGILNSENKVLTLVDRVNHHTTTGISTVEISSINAKKLNDEFKLFYNNKSKTNNYILKGNDNKIQTLKKLLDAHEITYSYGKDFKTSAYSYQSNKNENIQTNVSDLIISTDQPKGKLVNVLFEKNAKLSDSITYDITAWSLPYAYGLEAYVTNKDIPSGKYAKLFNNNTIDNMAIAYGVKWNHLNDAKFLTDLLVTKLKVRFNKSEFVNNGIKYNPGSLIIHKGDQNNESMFNEVIGLANKHNKKLNPIYSGMSEEGPDLGSSSIELIENKNIAILTGDGVSSLNYGAIWYFFEQEINYPLTHININKFNRIDINEFDVLIIPDGYYFSIKNEKNTEKIESWLKNGGKIIAFSKALSIFSNSESFKLKSKANNTNLTEEKILYKDQRRNRVNNMISGAIFKVELDNSHPMAFGYSKDYYSLKIGSSSYELLEKGYNVGVIKDNPKPVSGYSGKKALLKLDNTMIFGHEKFGKGNLIYFADNPLFRSFWENGKLFLVNSIFFID